jgi:hypothetical protein
MKISRSAAAITAVAAITTIAIAAGPALAASHNAGTATATHTLSFTAKPVYTASGKTYRFELDKDVRHGKVIATDELDFTSPADASVALARPGGYLYGKFTISNTGKLTGTITGGTGTYRGDTGTIQGHVLPAGGAQVTATYHK